MVSLRLKLPGFRRGGNSSKLFSQFVAYTWPGRKRSEKALAPSNAFC
jgi:hypothetical protein